MKQAIHRHPADSKRGRQIAAESTHVHEGAGLTREQQEHNAKVEAARRAKLERRRQRSEP